MKYYKHIYSIAYLPIAFLFLINSSCEEKLSKSVKLYNGGDITAPLLTRIKADTATRFIMEFNEHLSSQASSVDIDENMKIISVEITENVLTFELEKPCDPGKEYTITASVRDLGGNTALIVEKIYGFNPSTPTLLINEFITEGLKKNPDKVEILVISGGNTAGITLQEGGIRTYKQHVILPAIQVQKNDFIIVHFRAPEDAVSETKSKDESKLDIAYKTAWDVFHTHQKLTGIGNSYGALVLLKNPNGDPMDAVIYSNKKDDTTKEDRGFAKKEMYAWVKEIEKWSMWKSKNGNPVFPSDTLDPTDSTPTRSINRKSHSDTNSADDWYILKASKSTFGALNSTELSKSVKLSNGEDTTEPLLTRIKADTATRFIMEFNEHLSSQASSVEIDENMKIISVEITKNVLTFELEKPCDPGKEYTITASVRDLGGNTALIVEKIYGFNPSTPTLLINEFITEGLKKNPDKVEILVISGGNTAGITLQEGGIRTYKQRVILPAIQVQKNDFIIVHFRAPEDAVSETKSKDESKLDIAYKTAWDVFHTHQKLTGIGNSYGALVLLKSPNGDPMDAVIYSNKKDDTTKKDRGFANKKMYAWVKEIEKWSMWKSKNGNPVFPSDTLDPTDSTPTRSINRKSHSDTNSADDWYIVKTRKSTFGAPNSTEIYAPSQ